jgi:hypothetical protein
MQTSEELSFLQSLRIKLLFSIPLQQQKGIK